MKKTTKQFIISSFLTISILSFLFIYNPLSLSAQTPSPNLKNASSILTTAGGSMGYQTYTTKEIFIGNIIQSALSFIGIIFLILIIISGYQWMTAGGNDETVGKAKKRIINATIGLVVVLMAYAISYFILYTVLNQTITPIIVQ